VVENSAGYREIPHTADWELHVWGPNLPTLLEQAARGMYALSNTITPEESSVQRTFELTFLDQETLIVDFLNELLFYGEDEGLGFNSFEIIPGEDSFKCILGGAPIIARSKEIKAVTYHSMEVIGTDSGLEVNIVFDV
jgi:SHS2 domain-containing protein